MSNFTPGPWRSTAIPVERQWQDRLIVNLDGYRVAEAFCGIPATGHPVTPADLSRAYANARLIAAAPALLSALLDACEAMPFHESRCPMGDDVSPTNEVDDRPHLVPKCNCVFDEMRAAIAQAVGA